MLCSWLQCKCLRNTGVLQTTRPGTRHCAWHQTGGSAVQSRNGGVADATVRWWHGSSCATARGRGTSDQWDAGPAAGRRSTARPQSEEQSGSRAAAVRGQRPTVAGHARPRPRAGSVDWLWPPVHVGVHRQHDVEPRGAGDRAHKQNRPRHVKAHEF
jgi:hypothetical protein